MEYIQLLDNKIEEGLNNNMLYTLIIISLIVFCTFVSNTNNSYISLKMDNPYIRILFILSILYFGTKDVRLSLLLIIIFLIELDKLNMEEIKANIVVLMVKDSMLEKK